MISDVLGPLHRQIRESILRMHALGESAVSDETYAGEACKELAKIFYTAHVIADCVDKTSAQ